MEHSVAELPSKLLVTKASTCSPAFFLFFQRTWVMGSQGFLHGLSVLGRTEVWQDWKRAQAGTFVVSKFANHGTDQAAFTTAAPLAEWLLALTLWFMGSHQRTLVSNSINGKIFFIWLTNIVTVIMSPGIWDCDTNASLAPSLVTNTAISSFLLLASVSS